jgi:hypothetical protein
MSLEPLKNGTISPSQVPGIHFGKILPENLSHEAPPCRLKGPLHADVHDFENQEHAILTALNTKFLPTKIADQNDSLKQALTLEGISEYIIEVLYGKTAPFKSRFYAWGFSRTMFERIDPLTL